MLPDTLDALLTAAVLGAGMPMVRYVMLLDVVVNKLTVFAERTVEFAKLTDWLLLYNVVPETLHPANGSLTIETKRFR